MEEELSGDVTAAVDEYVEVQKLQHRSDLCVSLLLKCVTVSPSFFSISLYDPWACT